MEHHLLQLLLKSIEINFVTLKTLLDSFSNVRKYLNSQVEHGHYLRMHLLLFD